MQVVFYLESFENDKIVKLGETNIDALSPIDVPSVYSSFHIMNDETGIPQLCQVTESTYPEVGVRRANETVYVSTAVSFVGSRPKGH